MASPRSTALRASDADRERVVEFLRHQYADGRLSEDELAERIEAASAGRTATDLEARTADLPVPRQTAAAPRRRSGLEVSVRIHFTTYLLVNQIGRASCRERV